MHSQAHQVLAVDLLVMAALRPHACIYCSNISPQRSQILDQHLKIILSVVSFVCKDEQNSFNPGYGYPARKNRLLAIEIESDGSSDTCRTPAPRQRTPNLAIDRGPACEEN